ncbi:phosphotransacetylase family protein [Candidatus Omnitrophota bacterium]
MAPKKVRRIFISATGQNDGKTMVSLGLICAFKERFEQVGFIKPVGQRYLIVKNEKVDEDSVLIERICQIECAIKDMSPIAIERGFTQKYILNGGKEELVQRIKSSFAAVAKDKELVVIEGTGHAGVGSVFDLSNATVARMLDSKVIIVSSGGIGRPIDQIMLNAALFEKAGVEIAGVIINKVNPEKYDKVNRIVRKGLNNKGLRVLGVVPYKRMLAAPTVKQILEELDLKLLSKQAQLEKGIGNILVGAMGPHEAMKYFSDGNLIITPGDREDMISAVVGFQTNQVAAGVKISGIILTGGITPNKDIVDLVKGAQIPLLLARADTYSVASAIHDLTVKVRPEDTEKVRIIKELVENYIDLDGLIKQL